MRIITEQLKRITEEKGKREALEILVRADVLACNDVEKIVEENRTKLSNARSMMNELLASNLIECYPLPILNGQMVSPRSLGYVINQVLKRKNISPNDVYDWLSEFMEGNQEADYGAIVDSFVNKFGLFASGDGKIIQNNYIR